MKNILIACLALLTLTMSVVATAAESSVTKVVMLGTGTPNPNPAHSGPAVAIVVNDVPYLVDFGPGVVRQAAAMSPQYGGEIEGLATEKLRVAFLTHLHSDHTVGYPDLIFTPWVMGRDEPMEVFGPEGIEKMTQHVLDAWQEDIRYRLYGLQPANNEGWRVNAHTVQEGVVYEDANVKVEAFEVIHGSWPNAFGYRFTTPDKVIVISGDAAPSESIETYSKGADILIHEVYSDALMQQRNDPFWIKYYAANHTSGAELGKIAGRAQPGLLVLYHFLPSGVDPDDILAEVASVYDGRVVVAKDLDVY